MNTLKHLITALTVGLVLTSTGCSALKSEAPEIPADSSPSTAQDVIDVKVVKERMAAIQKVVGADGPAFDVSSITYTTDYLSVEAIDPEAPEELNDWTARKGEDRPFQTIIDYGGDEKALKATLFKADVVDLAALTKVVEDAKGRADLEKPTLLVSVDRDTFSGGEVRMMVVLHNPRNSKSYIYDLDGTFVRANQ